MRVGYRSILQFRSQTGMRFQGRRISAVRIRSGPASQESDGSGPDHFVRRTSIGQLSGQEKEVILPKDRDPRFITIRRGGTLTDDTSDPAYLGAIYDGEAG